MAYIGQGIKEGTFAVLDTSGNTYNGSNVTFSLGTQVGSPAQLLVSHDGVIQKPGTDYSLATGGTQITFSTAPASGASIFIVEISGAVGGPLDSDLNGTELILDADADTSITADTDDQIDIKIAGADDFTITANKFDALAGSNIHVSGDADADDITGDSAQGRVTLGAGQDLNLYHGGTNSYIVNDTGNLVINTGTSDSDIVFSGNDGGSAITALTIDMSAAGQFLFKDGTASLPVISNEGDPDTGIYFHEANVVGFTTQGVRRLQAMPDGSIKASTSTFEMQESTGVYHEFNQTTSNVTFRTRNSHGTPYGNAIAFSGAAPDNNSNYALRFDDNTALRCIIYSDGDIQNHDNSYGGTSDVKLKEQIKDASSQWDDIKDLKVRKFKFKQDVKLKGDSDEHWRIGLIAQEAETVSPSLIKNNPDRNAETNELEGTTTKSIKYSVLYMKAIKALQEAMTKIESLEARVTTLEG